jgi:hypothetical protein
MYLARVGKDLCGGAADDLPTEISVIAFIHACETINSSTREDHLLPKLLPFRHDPRRTFTNQNGHADVEIAAQKAGEDGTRRTSADSTEPEQKRLKGRLTSEG